jgi:hypothetical protein
VQHPGLAVDQQIQSAFGFRHDLTRLDPVVDNQPAARLTAFPYLDDVAHLNVLTSRTC